MTETSLPEPFDRGPLLLFGGPYGNLEATEAMRTEAKRLGIPPERTICTGDVAAYCADPEATATLLRDWGVAVVMGNCEESLGFGAEDCGCGFAEGTACDLLSAQWYAYSAKALSDETKAWMRGLPRHIRFTLGGKSFLAVHGAPDHISRFVFASNEDDIFARAFAETQTDGIIGGHCGLPFTKRLAVNGRERVWHNPGVIGVPANDGSRDVWFSLLDVAPDHRIRVEHRRLAYDHASAARRMREQALPEGYAAALETGLWPSLDVLPKAERDATGQRLDARGLDAFAASPDARRRA